MESFAEYYNNNYGLTEDQANALNSAAAYANSQDPTWSNRPINVKPKNSNPYGLGARIRNFFDGSTDRAREEYDRLLEESQLSSARAYEEWFDSTKYQRAVADLKKAGLNPWLAVQNGISGTGNIHTSRSNSVTKHSAKDYEQKSDKAQTIKNLTSSALGIIALLTLLG